MKIRFSFLGKGKADWRNQKSGKNQMLRKEVQGSKSRHKSYTDTAHIKEEEGGWAKTIPNLITDDRIDTL